MKILTTFIILMMNLITFGQACYTNTCSMLIQLPITDNNAYNNGAGSNRCN